MAPPTDETLAAQAVRGDRQAMESLIRRFLRPVHSVCRRVLADPTAAEDAAQETFMTAFQKLGTYDVERRFAPWILTIAARTAHNMIRTRQAIRRHESRVVPQPGGGDPSASLETRESLAGLKTTVEGLPDRDSLALYLRFNQDFTHDEIAAALDLPPGTVRVLLCRALAKLHDRLERELIP